jgi:hypothetical protein
MLKQIARLRVGLVFILGILLFCSGAFAMGDLRVTTSTRRDNREDRHYYRNGRWYKHDSRGKEIIVYTLSIGALVDALPPRHTTVVVEGTPYYRDDNYYYRQEPNGGYVVVPRPVLVSPAAQTPETVTINIPNSRGGYTAVVLRRAGYGFIGPQGEYYSDSPTVEQLRVLYGN